MWSVISLHNITYAQRYKLEWFLDPAQSRVLVPDWPRERDIRSHARRETAVHVRWQEKERRERETVSIISACMCMCESRLPFARTDGCIGELLRSAQLVLDRNQSASRSSNVNVSRLSRLVLPFLLLASFTPAAMFIFFPSSLLLQLPLLVSLSQYC